MADWQEQLNSILSDPEAMAQIVSIAQSISGNDGAPPSQGADAPPKGMPAVDPGAPQGMPAGLDPELLRRLAPLMKQWNRPETGETTALLLALKPFLSEKRRDKVERAAQLARLIHLGKTFLTTQEAERV